MLAASPTVLGGVSSVFRGASRARRNTVWGVLLCGSFLDARVPNNVFNSIDETDRCDSHVIEHGNMIEL